MTTELCQKSPLIVSSESLSKLLGVDRSRVREFARLFGFVPVSETSSRTLWSLPQILRRMEEWNGMPPASLKKAQAEKAEFDSLSCAEQAARIIDRGRSRAPRQKHMRAFLAKN